MIWGERLAGGDTVTLRFGTARPAVEVYDPTVGTEPVKTLGDVQALDLTLSNHPLIITISSCGL